MAFKLNKVPRILYSGVAAAAFAATSAAAPQVPSTAPQARLAIGDGTIRGDRLTPYTNVWMMSARRPDGQVIEQGLWTDVLRRRSVDGRNILERIQGMTFGDGRTWSTVNRFDPETMAPISSEEHREDGRSIARTFDGVHVTTRFRPMPGAPEEVRHADMPVAVYDFDGGMYGTLLAAQPLRTGYHGVIPAIDEFNDSYDPVPFRVVRRERIGAGASGAVQAWVVEIGAPATMTFWISERAPYVIRLVVPNGAGQLSWNMISPGERAPPARHH